MSFMQPLTLFLLSGMKKGKLQIMMTVMMMMITIMCMIVRGQEQIEEVVG